MLHFTENVEAKLDLKGERKKSYSTHDPDSCKFTSHYLETNFIKMIWPLSAQLTKSDRGNNCRMNVSFATRATFTEGGWGESSVTDSTYKGFEG